MIEMFWNDLPAICFGALLVLAAIVVIRVGEYCLNDPERVWSRKMRRQRRADERLRTKGTR